MTRRYRTTIATDLDPDEYRELRWCMIEDDCRSVSQYVTKILRKEIRERLNEKENAK